MSLSTAQKLAWSLATSLMVCITLFRAVDGDPSMIVHEYDPHSR